MPSPRSTASTPTRRGRSWGRRPRPRCLYGTGNREVAVRYRNRYGRTRSYTTGFEGVVPWLERRHTEAESDRSREQIEGYMREVPCPACEGKRLRPASLAVTIGGLNISEIGELSITKAAEFLAYDGALRARPADRRAGAQGSERAPEVPARRRPRLPEPQPLVRDPSPVGKRSASGSRRRWAAVWQACSTCSTSRRSGCTERDNAAAHRHPRAPA